MYVPHNKVTIKKFIKASNQNKTNDYIKLSLKVKHDNNNNGYVGFT